MCTDYHAAWCDNGFWRVARRLQITASGQRTWNSMTTPDLHLCWPIQAVLKRCVGGVGGSGVSHSCMYTVLSDRW